MLELKIGVARTLETLSVMIKAARCVSACFNILEC